MEGVDCDWCLVCDKHTNNGATYCSAECRSTDLISSSASSSSSSASSSSASSTESSYFSMTDINGAPLPGTSSSSASSFTNDNYPMPPFIRKQRTSIPNIYHQCTSNPNPPGSPRFMPGGSGSSALSHHLQQQQFQQQQQAQQQQQQQSATPGSSGQKELLPNSAASQYPLFYATLNALRPTTPSGPHPQD